MPPLPEIIQPLDTILGRVAHLVDYNQAIQIPELKALIDAHYPQLEREQIYYPDNVKKFISSTGSVLNKAFMILGGYLKTGVEKAGNFIDSKISEGEPTHLSETTKERWNKLKEGTNNVINVSSEYAGKILNPVV